MMLNKSLQNLFWYCSSFVIKVFLPLVTLPLFSQYLSIEAFGLFALSLFFGTFISGISNVGLLSIFERNYFEIKKENLMNFLFTILIFVSFNFLILVLITFNFSEKIAKFIFRNESVGELLLYGLFFCGVKNLNQYFYVYLKNRESAKIYSIIAISESVLNILFAVSLVINFSYGLKGFFIGQTFGSFLTFVFFCFYTFRFEDLKFKKLILSKSLKLSLPLTPRIFLGVINSQFDRYMLGLLGSIGGVGIFEIGQKIANSIFIFMTALQQVFSPQVYKRMFSDDPLKFRGIGQYLTPFFYVCILFAMPVALFSNEIIANFFPKEFHQSSSIVSTLSILYIIYFFGKQPQLMYAKKTSLISILTFFSIFLNISLNIPFIYYYGVFGAAIATLISGSISTLIQFYYGQRYTPIYYEKNILVIFSYYVLCVATVLIIQQFINDTLILISIKITMILLLIYLGIFFKVFKIKSFRNLFSIKL